jgi:hypothetical protein
MLAKVGKSDDEAIFTEARGIDGDAQAAVIPALAPERGSSTFSVTQLRIRNGSCCPIGVIERAPSGSA